jgi:hypothetical protein
MPVTPRPHRDHQHLKRQQKNREVMRRQRHQRDDHEAGRGRTMQARRFGSAQQQIGAERGQRRPERVRARFLTEPEQEGAGRGQQRGEPGRRWWGKLSPHTPARQHPDRGDKECRGQRRCIAYRELLDASACHHRALHQEVEERVLVDGADAAQAVADPQYAGQQIDQRLLDALHAQALVPPQRLEVKQKDAAQIGRAASSREAEFSPPVQIAVIAWAMLSSVNLLARVGADGVDDG